MNQALKQRLVGVLVLVALGVIFLPAVFNGGRPQQAEVLKDIPPPPAVAPLVFQEAERPEGMAGEVLPGGASQMYELEATSKQGEQQVVEKAPAPPSLDKSGLPNAWVLQVASLGDSKKADELKKGLQAKHYKAFTRTLKRDNKNIIRVMIGPEMDANKLASIKKAVDRDFKVKSIVVKFES